MKRTVYIILCVLAIILLGYTLYYAVSNTKAPTPPAPIVATTTPAVVEDKSIYTTKSGKKIQLIETNPVGESLSTITITPAGFSTNTPIILETNKLTNSFYFDLNGDSFEELIVTTVAQGSGSFGEVFLFTTASSTMLLPVAIPEMTEDDTKTGALFEGYMGHDSFTIENGSLVREFPTYKKTDPNNEPTGPRRKIMYAMSEKNGLYSVKFMKATSTSGVVTNTQGTSTTTAKMSPPVAGQQPNTAINTMAPSTTSPTAAPPFMPPFGTSSKSQTPTPPTGGAPMAPPTNQQAP